MKWRHQRSGEEIKKTLARGNDSEDEYLEPEFSKKRLGKRRFVETVERKEIGVVFRSSRSRPLKSDYKKGWQR